MATKRMVNHESCLLFLTHCVGFEQIKNVSGKRLTLPDNVVVDQLIKFRNALSTLKNIKNRNNKNGRCGVGSSSNSRNSNNSNNNDDTKSDRSSYEMKKKEELETKTMESDWKCNRCTFHNPFDLEECQVCKAPKAPLASQLMDMKMITFEIKDGTLINCQDNVWHCRKCGVINLVKSQRCESCNLPKAIMSNIVCAANSAKKKPKQKKHTKSTIKPLFQLLCKKTKKVV